MGLQTYDIGGGALGIRTHFDRVATAAAAVFAGRLVLRLYRQVYYARERRGETLFTRLAAWGSRRSRPITIAGIAFAVALPLLPFSSRYLIDLGTTVLIYVMLGWGLNVVVGLAGLLDLGYVAFYAVGAYTFALLARDLGFTFWEATAVFGSGGGELRGRSRVSGAASARGPMHATPCRWEAALSTRNVTSRAPSIPLRKVSPPIGWTLRLRDTGVGMDKNILTQVFKPFFTTKAPNQGTGVGLTTVRNVVNHAGGKVMIQSMLEKGTRVTVRMPRIPGPTI